MPCYRPLVGYRSVKIGPTGKRPVVFKARDAFFDHQVKVRCGQCIGCRLEKARQWALRCSHEASLHENNCFVTLTYSDKNLPKYNSLELRDFQKFMKRLRKHFDGGIRFFHCGEYGDKNGRPHYHAILFGIDFDDREIYKVSDAGYRWYTSKTLESI